MITILDDHRRPHCKFKMTRSHIFCPRCHPSKMYNMLLFTRSVPVLAEIVIVGHSRWRMSCRPVRHTGHLARQPLVEGGRGRVLLSSSFFFFFFLLTKSCAQVVLLTITGSHSNSGRSQSSSPFLSSPQLGTRGSTTAYFHRQGGAAVRNPPPTRTAPQLPTHPTSLPQHHCIVLTFDSWHWHHSILNSIGIINLACPVFTFCKSS